MVPVGIDVGSLYARIAAVGTDGAPYLCPDQEQAGIVRTPSTVQIGVGGALVGLSAEEVLEESPRLPAVRNARAALGATEPVLTDASGRAWHADAVLAILLKKLGRDIRAFTNDSISTAIFAVPTYGSDALRRGLKDAALLAGLGEAGIVEAPLAAARYHASMGGREELLLVIDVGADGHDCALLKKDGEGFTIAMSAGSASHGSANIDRAIAGIVADQFRDEHGADIMRDPANDIPLRQLAEQIKLALLGPGDRPAMRQTVLMGRRIIQLVVTRRLVLTHALAVLQAIEASIRKVLSAAEVLPVAILLIGGARQIIGLRRVLADLLPDVPVHEREFAAVMGAALAADAAGIGHGGPGHGRLVGDIGMRVWDAVKNAPGIRVLIADNSALPAQQTVTLYTRRTNQERLVLDLVKRTGTDEAGESLATFEFGPFANVPKDHPIEIIVACDSDAIIKVTARDPQSRREISQYSSDIRGSGAERLARQRDLVASLSVNE